MKRREVLKAGVVTTGALLTTSASDAQAQTAPLLEGYPSRPSVLQGGTLGFHLHHTGGPATFQVEVSRAGLQTPTVLHSGQGQVTSEPVTTSASSVGCGWPVPSCGLSVSSAPRSGGPRAAARCAGRGGSPWCSSRAPGSWHDRIGQHLRPPQSAQGPRARYRGTRRNTFDLRRRCGLQNLESIHRRIDEQRRLAA
jgi:hypothetical protein